MNGSLRQRGTNSWELRVYAGTDTETGRSRYASRTVRGSRREAVLELETLATAVGYPRRRALDTTMGELFERWYAAVSPGWAANTVRHTHSVLKVHLEPRFGHLPVGKVTTADIDAFYGELRTGGGRDGRPLADGSVRRIHGVLHRALAQAVRWEWIWTNPAEHASPPLVDQREIHSPPPEAVVRLLEASRATPGLELFFRLAAVTGARRGQLCALRWRDVDTARQAISFVRSLAEGRSGGLVVVATKNRRRNRVSIDPTTTGLLVEHRRRAERRAAGERVEWESDTYVFAWDAPGLDPWKPNWVTKRFTAVRSDVGLQGHRLHDLRHFMATEMLAAGDAVPVVAARLAHARASTTLNVYAHAVPAGDRQAAERLAARLDRVRSAHNEDTCRPAR